MDINKQMEQRFQEEVLESHDYPKVVLRSRPYRYAGKSFPRIEVMDNKKKYTIQAFVIMSPEEFDKCTFDKYPFYRSYHQKSPFEVEVNPSCSVAVRETDGWHICDAHDFAVERPDSFLNYQAALVRFNRRLGRRLLFTLKTAFVAAFVALAAYSALYALSVNGLLKNVVIPFDSAVILCLGVLITLAVLPLLLPYVDSLNLPGVSFKLRNKESDKQRL